MGLVDLIKNKTRRLVLGYRASSDDYIAFLQSRGAIIGENVKIYAPNKTMIDATTPYMLQIGNEIIITGPVTILTHDYSTHICNVCNSSMLACVRPVTIGNNVFLGWGCTILAGTTIGDNVIIGPGAVVSGKVESNSVYAGNPAKWLMSIEKYFQRHKRRQLKEAIQMFHNISEHFHRKPTEKDLWAYRNVFSGSYQVEGDTSNEIIYYSYDEFCAYVPNIDLRKWTDSENTSCITK